jgi:D-glycero-D-manno-heptose 1,7-bisphosphate phosphatase
MNRGIFLDRDGVINRGLLHNGKPFSPRMFEEFEILPGVKNALDSFRDMGFINIVITNQPDIARGLMDIEELNKMHSLIRGILAVDDIFVCPHDENDYCLCRKPKGGMLIEASKKWWIDLKTAFMIGDTWKDMIAGKEAGCETILVDMPYNQKVESDYRVKELKEAIEIIKSSINSPVKSLYSLQ